MAVVINGNGTVTGLAVGGLPDGIVDSGTLATNSVDSAELVDGSIDNSHLAANSVDSDQYVDGSIDNAHYANNSISLSKMGSNSVDSDQYVDGSIDAAHLASGVGGVVKSYAAGNIDLGSNIAGSYSAYTATGVTFSITTTASNSNLIVNASGWIAHCNPTSNTGTQVKLYRKINSGSYGSTSTHHLYSDYVVGSASYNWDEMSGHLQIYDGPSHTAGDVITYQFYYQPHNSSSGYFHHTGGVGASTLSWSILEV